MNYVLWCLVGVVIAFVIGAGPRRQAYRPNVNTSVFASAFGAVIGGVIGDGVPHALAGQLTATSLIGAAVGAMIFCWAVRERAEDAEP
ncbi:MAG: hypothetical protein IPO81_17515 [Kouleothrix sp.]|nr:hypothetical protein [Kouleothrix sp.]